MEKPARTLAVIMQRRNARSRWAEVDFGRSIRP